jgi:hypothetical protein
MYANKPSDLKPCYNCNKFLQEISINPRALGALIDETGSVSKGEIVVSRLAWAQIICYDDTYSDLLGNTSIASPMIDLEVNIFEDILDLYSENQDLLAELDQSLLFARVSVLFHWKEDIFGGRIGACGIYRA